MSAQPTTSADAARRAEVSPAPPRDTSTWADAERPDAKAVLIVEDDPKFADLLTRVFEGPVFTTITVGSGDEALRLLDGGLALHAAVVDVMIPHPDGLELCRHVRMQAPTLPVVVISARAGAPHRARALAAGASAFLEKPFALRDLVALTTSLIGHRPPETS